jgi:ATP-dependent DNA helicase RecQ
MLAQRPVRIVLPPTELPERARAPRERRAAASSDENQLDAEAQALFERLRAHRLEVAKAEEVPPYVVASDRTLREVALLRPKNLFELQRAHGIGPTKADRYGEGLLEVIRAFG